MNLRPYFPSFEGGGKILVVEKDILRENLKIKWQEYRLLVKIRKENSIKPSLVRRNIFVSLVINH